MAIPSIPKPLVLLPLIYFSRKLDTEDDDLIFKLRAAFYTVHALMITTIVYLYLQASAFANTPEGRDRVFYSSPASPFANPNAKKKWTEVALGAYMITTLRNLLGSTCFMILVQTGVHWYKGAIGGLLIQSIMGPLNFFDNAMVKYLLLGEKEALDTKKEDELGDNDEIVDAEGNPINGAGSTAVATAKSMTSSSEPQTFEDVLLDTWDNGAEADIKPLMAVLNKQNINHQTIDSSWTPVMIMAGLGVKETKTALKTMKNLGADLSMVDADGWNALHWSAFHGSGAAAEVILSPTGFDGVSIGLHLVKDKEGKTALDHAIAEDNQDVVKVLERQVGSSSSQEGTTDDGLRKRK